MNETSNATITKLRSRDTVVGIDHNWIKFSTKPFQSSCFGVLDTDSWLSVKLLESASVRIHAKPCRYYVSENSSSYHFIIWKVRKRDCESFISHILDKVRNMAFINGYSDYDEIAASLKLLEAVGLENSDAENTSSKN
jgi:hypothetical protein